MGENLREFLRSQSQQGFFVELTSQKSTALAFVNKIFSEVDSIKLQIEVLKRFEADKNLASVTALSAVEQISIRQGLYFSILVRYFKLFADASTSPGYIKLDKNAHLRGASVDLLNFHDEIELIRDRHISHGIHDDCEEVIPRMQIAINETTHKAHSIFEFLAIKRFSTNENDLNKLIQLLDIISANLKPKYDKLFRQVCEEIDAKSVNEWIEEGINQYKKRGIIIKNEFL